MTIIDEAAHADEDLFENLADMAYEGESAFAAETEIPGEDEPVAYATTEGSLEHGFDLDVELADQRLA